MYQFYYADNTINRPHTPCVEDVRKHFHITAVRPTMWEEHCLECAAPLCYQKCLHYAPRKDGRCRRFENGYHTFAEEKACCGQAAHVTFRPWANMMTIVFPAGLEEGSYQQLFARNQRLGAALRQVANAPLPTRLRWEGIRIPEFLRRRSLRGRQAAPTPPDAFIFHGVSYHDAPFRLMLEVYDDHTPLFKTAIPLQPGENLQILPSAQLSPACWQSGNLIKIYPENNLPVALDLLWCDFVWGSPVAAEQPAPQLKCLVWDLDNTLWNGTLIETEDPSILRLNPLVKRTLRQLDERGILLSIASRNDHAAAWTVVEQLGLAEYFLYPQIHWNAKSGSLRQIAASLNIGVDALALIDDSAFERREVAHALPQVRTYDITDLPGLLNRPECQVPATEESRNRRNMYRAEAERTTLLQTSNTNLVDFLAACHLQTELFTPATEEERIRCLELVVRTNQLNMSGRKYNPEQFASVLARPGHTAFAFRCRDDYGSYGTVGFGQYRVEGERLVFTEFAMSCRVAGKFVESALFVALLRREGCTRGEFEILKTKKNILLRNTLEGIGFRKVEEEENRILYHFDAALLHGTLVEVVYR